MPLYQQIFVALLCVLAALWIAGFVGELVAWRRGLPSITDSPPLPPVAGVARSLAWWEHVCWGAFFAVFVLPLVGVALIIVAPPVFAVSLLARPTRRPTE